MQRHCFQAMGTRVDCLLEADPSAESGAAFWAVEAEFRRLETFLSRFLPNSQLSALNRNGSVVADHDLVRVTQLALAARERTRGRFDPTVHDALIAAGYDRSFERLAPEGVAAVAGASRCGGAVSVDSMSGLIELEPGFRLDLGGIAKGDAVDRTCEVLGSVGACLVNAGGDLAVRGVPADGPWPIGLATADGEITIGLESGALATSGRDRRRWRRSGEERHHLIDPVTGRPSRSDLITVTVIAPSAVEAEIFAKSLFLLGERGAIDEAQALGLECVLVTADGRSVLSDGLA
jgi:FAD:protein FMN transferase